MRKSLLTTTMILAMIAFASNKVSAGVSDDLDPDTELTVGADQAYDAITYTTSDLSGGGDGDRLLTPKEIVNGAGDYHQVEGTQIFVHKSLAQKAIRAMGSGELSVLDIIQNDTELYDYLLSREYTILGDAGQVDVSRLDTKNSTVINVPLDQMKTEEEHILTAADISLYANLDRVINQDKDLSEARHGGRKLNKMLKQKFKTAYVEQLLNSFKNIRETVDNVGQRAYSRMDSLFSRYTLMDNAINTENLPTYQRKKVEGSKYDLAKQTKLFFKKAFKGNDKKDMKDTRGNFFPGKKPS